jgi:imidazolonepropionase-like amidohydrolase
MIRSAFLATLVVGVASAAPAAAQAPPTLPDHYALTNVRIVTAPGRVIERGTVVLRDGRIVAVGPQVAVPAGAIRLDLSGHTVYPGLVDAASSVGLPSLNRPPQGGPGGGGGGAPAGGDEVSPDREAQSVFAPSEAELAAVRNAGITTLGLAFDGGIFPGRIAAVHTGADGERVLRTPVAQQVLLGRRRGGYPGTLMASLAYVQQSFLDAQHGMRVRQAWERQPSGPRPTYNEDHRALEPAATGQLPMWFMANAERDIGRIVDLAAEIGVTNYVIVGAQEGWRAVADLRRAGKPVVVSLDFPAPGVITGRAFEGLVAPVSGRDAAKDQADSTAVQEARANAAALSRAGVTLALSSYGMGTPAQLRERARMAVQAGLGADDALRALTITPARLLGLDAAIGTVEAGKLANLVVTNGDLFAAETRIVHVFVDGIHYDVPAPATRPAGQRAAGGAAAAAIAGEWVGEMEGPTGLMQFVLTIGGAGSTLTGRITSEIGEVDLRGEETGSEFALRGTAAPPGMTAMSIAVTGRVTNDDLRGTMTIQGMSSINFTARRRNPGASTQEAAR